MSEHRVSGLLANGAAERRPLALAPVCAAVLGALVRLSYVVGSDFPLNDGGLFYLMTQELQRNGYRLPAYTAYNGAGIPFAYPPLGLYLAGLVDAVGPWSLLDVFRFLPLVLNVLTIPAFYALACDLLPTKTAAGYAVLAFALLPGSFAWQIMGGGVTRAPGFLFAILAIRQGYLLFARGQARHLWSAIVLATCTVLSHPSMAFLLAYSLALFFLTHGRQRRGLIHASLTAVGTAVLTAPWWATLVARHGPGPLLSAGASSAPLSVGLIRLTVLSWTDEAFFPILGGLALLGCLASLKDRRFLLPAWLAAMFVLDPRAAFAAAVLPVAMLAALGICRVLLPFLQQASRCDLAGPERSVAANPSGKLPAAATLAFLLAYAVFSSLASQRPPLVALSLPQREAMRWIAANTPQDSRFVVISPGETGVDWSAEWFPVLAERVSLTTYQGYEWLGGDVFRQRLRSHRCAQGCGSEGTGCLKLLREQAGACFTHVYVVKENGGTQSGSTATLRCSLDHDAGYRLLYDGEGAAVYRLE